METKQEPVQAPQPTSQPEVSTTQGGITKTNKFIFILIALVILLILAAGGYYYFQMQQKTQTKVPKKQVTTVKSTPDLLGVEVENVELLDLDKEFKGVDSELGQI